MDKQEEYLKRFSALTTNYVQKASELEMLMINIIAKHFCGNTISTKLELIAFMHDYVQSFDARMKMFSYIIETHHAKILEQRPRLIGDIKSFVKIRNYLSHRILSSTYKDGDKFILKRPIKTDTMKPPYKGFNSVYDDFTTTAKEHDSQMKKANEIMSLLRKLTNL